jgi:hypothetical protein
MVPYALQMKSEGLVRNQYKCLVPIYVFPEMKLHGLVISKTELHVQCSVSQFSHSCLCALFTVQYIFPGSVCLFCCSHIDRQILGIYKIAHRYKNVHRNWERGHTVSFLGIHKSDFSLQRV